MTQTAQDKHANQLNYSRENNYNKYQNDPEFRAKKNKQMNEFNKNKYQNDEVFREKNRIYRKEFYQKNKLKRLEESKLKDNLKKIEDQISNLTTV